MRTTAWIACILVTTGCTCSEPAEPSGPVPAEPELPAPPRVDPRVHPLWIASFAAPGTVLDDTSEPEWIARYAIRDDGPISAETPEGDPIGVAYAHEGVHHLRRIRELTPPFPLVTAIGPDGACTARVTSAIEGRVHLEPTFEPDPEEDDDEEVASDRSVTAFAIEPCEGTGPSATGIVGAPARFRAITLAPGAPPSVRAALGPDAPAELTHAALGESGAFLVTDDVATSVVRSGRVVSTLSVPPFAEIVAGNRVFLLCPSPSGDDFLLALDDLGTEAR